MRDVTGRTFLGSFELEAHVISLMEVSGPVLVLLGNCPQAGADAPVWGYRRSTLEAADQLGMSVSPYTCRPG